ncbi:MFS transporter [Nocardiopsis composta]|uniref:Putative MFS family arabinose efflux permease n=1 Tax=Nocardiopsis composta TaxID=157465 RepID=A0A7W8QGQ2_9ACTN|nr:MFS transporter [Nocardiopsis composta]MBB5430177.1 putative MFS family arabinose efflux permease [Nocardiopsis composta]
MTSPASPPAADTDTARTTLRQWVAIAVLSLSTFLVVTSEMLPVGVLTPMADGLGVSSGTAGFSLTITGLVAAVTAPVVPRILGPLDRRTVLAVAMLVLAAGNALTVLAQGFALLVVARVILGIGMGTVWGLASAVAIRLVAPRNAALAVSFAVSGVAAASVIGVPLGTVIGDAFGWRAAFGTLAAVSVVLAAGLLATLPRLPRPAAAAADGGGAGGRSLLTPAVLTGLAVIASLVTAHFAAYTYVRPVLEEYTGIGPAAIAFLLLVYGVFGLAGNFAAGALAARRARATVLVLAGGIGAALVLLVLLGAVTVFAGLAIALWGLTYGGLSVAGQIWMTRAAPHRVEHVTGLYVGVFTAAIALGAFLGGTVVEATGIIVLLWSTAALSFASLAIGLFGPGPAAPRPERAEGPAGGARQEAASPAE